MQREKCATIRFLSFACAATDQSLLALLVVNEEMRLLQRQQLHVLQLSILQSCQQVGAHFGRAQTSTPRWGCIEQTSEHASHQLQMHRVADRHDEAEQRRKAACNQTA